MTYATMDCAALEAEADAILEANPLPAASQDDGTLPNEPLSEDEGALLAVELAPRVIGTDDGLYPQEQHVYADQLRDIEARCENVVAFHRDGRSNETSAETRQRQRRNVEHKRALVNCVQIAANVETTSDKVLEVLSGLPLDMQHRVALLAQREADLRAIRKIQSGSDRERRLSQGVADILQAIGRDGPQTRRRIAAMGKDEQAEALADLIAEQRVAAQRRRSIEWAKQRRFDAARAIQRENCIEEIIARFRALPDEPRQSLLATLISESDEALA